MPRGKLVLLEAGMFCQGMHLKAKIYYLYKGSYVLLCKDAYFTKELTARLHDLAEETGGVYIEESSYEEVWSESLRRHAMDADSYFHDYQRVRHEYEQILEQTTSFLQDVAQTGRVHLNSSQRISDNIADDLWKIHHGMALRCISMIGAADSYLYTHCVNVASLNGLIGQWMQLPEKDIQVLIKVGLLHDLGKLKIPPEVLNKPGPLTEAEFAIIKTHSRLSYELLQHSGEKDERVLQAILQHHERTNGSGYPLGLHLADISLFARITAVSDVYDAMVSKRCYKDAFSPFEILEQFKQSRFSDLDLQIINIFLENITFLFVGMTAMLSNGDYGEIVFVPPSDLANPMVKVGQHIFTTSEDCKCVSLVPDEETYPSP